ncbi:MAG: extensin family protein [Pseudaminobacter sp.]|nr:extensin family protein [Pseudaminobacter sp.]
MPIFLSSPRWITILTTAAFLAASAAQAQTPDLPEKIPVPEVHEPPAGNITPEKLGGTPVPEPRPDGAPLSSDPPGDAEPAPPELAPVPAEKPETEGMIIPPPPAAARKDEESDAPAGESLAPTEPADPRSMAPRLDPMPPEEQACRQRLRSMDVAFEERPPQADPAGCALPYPLAVKRLGKTLAIEPEALMNCAMAEASAHFAANVVAPAARREFGADLKSISNASTYVCRPRNGSRKMSEHAFGNALDIARFTLSNDTQIDVEPAPDARAAKFLAAIRKAACGPFKTVLGPGSDADHALHFHFDLAPRKNGGTFCQ